MRIALYQPEIAGNVGAVLRLAACLGVAVDIVHPTGFLWSDARMKRAGMDYIDHVETTHHDSYATFKRTIARPPLLLTTKGETNLYGQIFRADDILLFGQESAGVPETVGRECGARIRIPMRDGARSLNLAVSCGIATAEALRQTGGLPC